MNKFHQHFMRTFFCMKANKEFFLITFGFAIFCRQNISEKSTHKMLMKLTPGVNFINIIRTNFLYEHRFSTYM